MEVDSVSDSTTDSSFESPGSPPSTPSDFEAISEGTSAANASTASGISQKHRRADQTVTKKNGK